MWNGCAQCLAIIDDIPLGGETCKSCGRLYCEFCYHNYRAATTFGLPSDSWRCLACYNREYLPNEPARHLLRLKAQPNVRDGKLNTK